MSGIQVHTEDPINTRTDPPPTSTGQAAPVSAAATTTASAPSSTYPAAQPGARPPAPTGSVASSAYTPNPTATSTYAPPTSTTTTSSGQPPAPQPGAVPVAPSQEQGTKSAIPPPPKAGEKLQSPSHYAPNPPAATSTGQAAAGGVAGAGAGYAFPSATSRGTLEQPLRGIPPAGQTSVANPGLSQQYGAQIPNQSLEHPPGYKQDPYAGDRGPSAYDSGYGNGGNGGIGGGPSNSQGEGIFSGLGDTISNLTSGGGGGGNTSGGSLFPGGAGGGADNDEGIMSTMGTWAKGVGKKAAELESEVWKRVNGEK